MEIFSFIISMFVMMVASQYGLYWLMIIVAGVAAFMSKEKKVLIIFVIYIAILYFITGTSYESYGIYVAAVIIVVYLILNKGDSGGEEEALGGMGDQYGDLLKGLGGGGGGM